MQSVCVGEKRVLEENPFIVVVGICRNLHWPAQGTSILGSSSGFIYVFHIKSYILDLNHNLCVAENSFFIITD